MTKFMFVWNDIYDVSTNYHNNGGLGVIAESLDAARLLLNTPFQAEYKIFGGGTRWVEERHVPENCEAFTVDPDIAVPVKETDPEIADRVFVWPNAGCC